MQVVCRGWSCHVTKAYHHSSMMDHMDSVIVVSYLILLQESYQDLVHLCSRENWHTLMNNKCCQDLLPKLADISVLLPKYPFSPTIRNQHIDRMPQPLVSPPALNACSTLLPCKPIFNVLKKVNILIKQHNCRKRKRKLTTHHFITQITFMLIR